MQNVPRVGDVPEVVLARVWQDGWHARELRATDGRRVSVVYRGVWTHSDGPDFRDALIDAGGELLRGAVELHRRASDWRRHGHDANPDYNDVVLHVVLANDLPEPIQTPDGRALTTVELAAFLPGDIEQYVRVGLASELGRLGARACLPTLAGGQPELVLATLRRAGWRRLAEKQLRFQQEFERLPPAEALHHGLLDALGLLHNRAGMARVADTLPLATLESLASVDRDDALAALLGVGGFLPLSPAHQQAADLTPAAADALAPRFERLARELDVRPLPASVWNLNRVRPANHPARRLASYAALLRGAAPAGLLAAVASRADGPPSSWRAWLRGATPALGASRADQVAVNVLAPFLAAYAEATGDAALAERAGQLWETLPGALDDSVARLTLAQIGGTSALRITLAIENQGLHQIGRHGCAELRCFECPIAELALRHESDLGN